jgi:hypothetical protein
MSHLLLQVRAETSGLCNIIKRIFRSVAYNAHVPLTVPVCCAVFLKIAAAPDTGFHVDFSEMTLVPHDRLEVTISSDLYNYCVQSI